MVKVRIISGPIHDHLAIAGIEVAEGIMNIKGKPPGQIFDAMIALEMDWEVVLDSATEAEWQEWALADVVCRKVRAEKMGKTIIFCGEPITYDEFQEKLLAFMAAHHTLPALYEDNSVSLIFGMPPDDEEVV